MEIHKKILLILTIIVASIILYRLWIKRINIEKDIELQDPFQTHESFTSNNLMSTNDMSFPLNHYFVKASWNTAYTGSHSSKYKSNTMDISMVIDVIHSGCRFLDFEIYAIKKTTGKNTTTSVVKSTIIPVVGFSNQVNNNYQMECNEPTVKLEDVLTAIFLNASMGSYGSDPLFVQLRVKSANIELYKSLLEIINRSGFNTEYSLSTKESINEVVLKKLKNRKYLIADLENSDLMFTNILRYNLDGYGTPKIDDTTMDYVKSGLIPGYQKIFSSFTAKPQYTEKISSLSNSKVLSLPIKEYDVDLSGNITYIKCPDKKDTGIYYQSYPDFSIFNISNLDKMSVYNLIINHSIHILPFRFYIDDNNLFDYEQLFNNNGKCAFIKMGTIKNTYSNKLIKSFYEKNQNFGSGIV